MCVLSPDAFVLSVAGSGDSPQWVQMFLEWSRAEAAWELWVIAFGFVAQALFFCRWLVQWYISERRGESHMPLFFWWLSLSGATLLLIYYILRHEPVGILGQCIGWAVYSRNLWLIRKKSRNATKPRTN